MSTLQNTTKDSEAVHAQVLKPSSFTLFLLPLACPGDGRTPRMESSSMVGVSEFAPEAQGLAGFLQDPVHLIPFHRHDHGTSSESAIPSFPYLTYKLVQDIDTFYFLFYF